MAITGALFYLWAAMSSIHEIEYQMHRAEANWTPVLKIQQPYTPIINRARGMLKNYYGYLPYWTDTTYFQYFKMNLLTHISYFSVDIDPASGSLGSIPNISRLNRIRDYGHDWGVRIHMTFTLFGSSGVTSFLNNAAARQAAINNIADLITNYGLEGANIDFEFVTGSVRDSFNLFINGLSSALWNHLQGRKELYIASIAVPEWYPGYDIAYLADHTDGLFIMAYDFHWSGSSVAGPVSPCVPSSFWGQYCAAKSIGSYKADGAGGSKIILGLPYYGYDWPTVSSDMGSATTGTGSAVIYYYAFQNANTYGYLWDSYSQTPWYRYYSVQWHQCWYDDSVSLDIKFGMVNDSLLQGAGCWALGYDRSYDHIWNAIRRNFWVEPPERHFTVLVNIDSLNVRDGPGTDYNIITIAEYGSKFVAFDYVNNWYKVYFPSKSGPYYAWMSGGDGTTNQFMKGTTQNTILRVSTGLLNIRDGPGTSYPIITHIAEGQVFVADSFAGDWARIYLPIINGYSKGWCYHPYTTIIQNPEDYNIYQGNVIELTYPGVMQENDTFTVSLRIQNTGFGPFDSLVYLKGSEPSPFYNAGSWFDNMRAKTDGFPGLPNQTFYISSLFRAPDVSSPTVIADTFGFERKTVLFGPQVIITVTVNPVGVVEETIKSQEKITPSQTVFSGELELSLPSSEQPYTISVYDVMGRRIACLRAQMNKPVTLGKELRSGIYFVIMKSGSRSLIRKIVKTK